MICYLDNSATTRPLDEVTDFICEINKNFYGNPSSLHSIGFDAEKIVKKARETVLASIGDIDGTLVFTAGGTESNNLAIIGYIKNKLKRSPKIITSKIEHPSVTEPFMYLKEEGADVHFCAPNEKGMIDLAELESMVDEKTELVSLMLVNNEVGSVLSAAKACEIIKRKNPKAIFHVDAVQAYGKVPINVKKMGIDMLSISGHKINGPKGIGALYVRQGITLLPVMLGGHQEKNLRSGTENVPAIGGLLKAAERVNQNLMQNIEKMSYLKNMLLEELKKIPFCHINGGDGEGFAPNIINASFDFLKSEVLLHSLEKRGVFVSSGSACSSNKPAPSHVLSAMGLDRKRVDTAIRISLCPENTEEEILYAIDVIKEETKALYDILKR
ncbi:MAG: cysteine desulfurase [Clostridia bacterium]|nr:cysteine desulfurase [Clostridia bacterium]